VVDEFTDIVGQAEKGIVEEIKANEVSEEPKITERFVERLRTLFREKPMSRDFDVRMMSVHTQTIEPKLGADVCIVFDMHFRNFMQTKGVLIQAKMEDSWLAINGLDNADKSLDHRGFVSVSASPTRQFVNLQEQARRMLVHTPDSFGIVYGTKGFVTLPASSIAGLRNRDEIPGKSITRFFREFLLCFIGDPRLSARNQDDLRRLVRERESKLGLLVTVEGKGDYEPKEPRPKPPIVPLTLALLQGMEPTPIPAQ